MCKKKKKKIKGGEVRQSIERSEKRRLETLSHQLGLLYCFQSASLAHEHVGQAAATVQSDRALAAELLLSPRRVRVP